MSKNNYPPYNFNIKKEYNIYKKIGSAYKSKKGFICNESNTSCPKFDNYLDWEQYFKNKFLTQTSNNCNFQHYLIRKYRQCKVELEIYSIIEIPVLILQVSVLISNSTSIIPGWMLELMLFLSIILIIIIGIPSMYAANSKMYFFEDCINILEKGNVSE